MLKLVSYWDGDISWLEKLCILSMNRHGYRLELYSYNPDALQAIGLPCDIVDAREIIPETHPAYRYVTSGYFTIFSNYFRLALQVRGKGLWVDCDCFFLKPIPAIGPYIFGRTHDGKINTAVMQLPKHEPMLGEYMTAITADPMRLPWSTFRRRLYRNIEIILGKRHPDVNRRTGVGPRAFTYYLDKYKLSSEALPPEWLYPVESAQAGQLVSMDRRVVDARITNETVLVHLWQGYLKHYGYRNNAPPAGTFLGDHCVAYHVK